MASNMKRSKAIRKHKLRTRGKGRKREIRRAQRIQSEARLEAALGEKIPLEAVRS